MSLDTFEQSLLGELRHHVAGRRTRVRPARRTVALVAGGVAATGATAVALALGTSVAGPAAAFAVESQPDGDVVVTVHDLSDASGLEHALAAKGVDADVRYVPGFTQDEGSARHAGAPGAACDIALAKVDGGLRFTLGAAQIASGARLDIVTSGSSPSDVGSPVEVAWSGGSC
ncbi:hypothetical protein [Cellulomonas alba]|uniref:LytR/CpsA/Psr regulator C-terminal domain-containing protein n=1 Tax=Cellulomonas alba TaxID=3053467 RepID=A0ABT7SCI6_9CELL|nr:hypothetical protein [Cellulomonas alba]MDM7853890.1 hypothetical protein [Cellulomonas alba]